MLKDSFLDLIQIQSLQKKIETLNQKMEGELKRIKDIGAQIKWRNETYLREKADLSKINLDLKENEGSLFKTDKKLTDALVNQKKVVSEKEANAISEEISSLQKNKLALEDKIFSLLEEQETLQTSLKDFESFQEGIQKTILDIKKEVEEKNNIELKEIKNLKEREKNLISILPKEIGAIFLAINKKFKTNSLAFIEHGKCGVCKMSIPSMVCQEVEHLTTVETCPSCGRILLPSSIT